MSDVGKLARWCESLHADLGQLDILVEDIKAQEAIRINTRGLKAQAEFLLKHMPLPEAQKVIRHELRMLHQTGMVMQSKFIPENNIKWRNSGRRNKRSHSKQHDHTGKG